MNLRQAPYPKTRHRRLRKSPEIRGLSRENKLSVEDLIWPILFARVKTLRSPSSLCRAFSDIV